MNMQKITDDVMREMMGKKMGMAKGGPTLGLIPGKVDPTVADDTNITTPSGANFNAKIGEYVIPQEVVAALGTKFFDNLVLKEKKQLGLPQEVGPKMHDEPDSMGRMDKPMMGMANGGKTWTPPFETDYTQLVKDNPISSVATLGIAPVIAKAGGFAGNVVSAMGADTDPMAMVKGRTADVSGQLSSTTKNLATPASVATQVATGQPVVGIAQNKPPVIAPSATTKSTPLGWQSGNGKTSMDFINDNPQVPQSAPNPAAERPAYGITTDAKGNKTLYGKGDPQTATQSLGIAPPQYQQSELAAIPTRQAPQGRPGLSDSNLASFINSVITDGNWMRSQSDTERNQAANESIIDKLRKDQIAQDANKNSFNSGIYGKKVDSADKIMESENKRAELGLKRVQEIDKVKNKQAEDNDKSFKERTDHYFKKWDALNIPPAYKQNLQKYAAIQADAEDPKGNLFILGANGQGRTGAAMPRKYKAVYEEYIKRGLPHNDAAARVYSDAKAQGQVELMPNFDEYAPLKSAVVKGDEA